MRGFDSHRCRASLMYMVWRCGVASTDNACDIAKTKNNTSNGMTPVGLEPTQLALVELESTPLDHSGKVSYHMHSQRANA